MTLWRISRHADLSGTGGLHAPGRWHWVGQPIVYLSESPSAALLEVCVHTSANDVPPDITLLRIEVPDKPVSTLRTPAPDWQAHPEITRDAGTEWLRAGKAALVRVPSAIVPMTWNYLLNPLHRDARRCRIMEKMTYPFDVRIKV